MLWDYISKWKKASANTIKSAEKLNKYFNNFVFALAACRKHNGATSMDT